MFPTAMPSPRLPDPMDAPPLRWGVLGTGWIAERFTAALHRSTRQRVVAVGSRSVGSAKEFADRVGVQRAHGSYTDLTADPEVDVVHRRSVGGLTWGQTGSGRGWPPAAGVGWVG
jgi:hypothetical protein